MKIRKKSSCKHEFITFNGKLYGGVIIHDTYCRSMCKCEDCGKLLYHKARLKIESVNDLVSLVKAYSEENEGLATLEELF